MKFSKSGSPLHKTLQP